MRSLPRENRLADIDLKKGDSGQECVRGVGFQVLDSEKEEDSAVPTTILMTKIMVTTITLRQETSAPISTDGFTALHAVSTPVVASTSGVLEQNGRNTNTNTTVAVSKSSSLESGIGLFLMLAVMLHVVVGQRGL